MAVAVAAAACSGAPEGGSPPATVPSAPVLDVAWEEVALPAPAGERRLGVRDVTWCGDRWLVVGGVLGPGADSRPAAWSSPDGRAWREIRFRTTTYWGARSVLSSVACREAEPVAVGAMSGGAHGNPRVATFRSTGRGVWVDVPAPFEQYGGPSAVNVGGVTAGPHGWLIAGNRRSGPAVWIARSPFRFDLVEEAPGLVDEDAPLAHGGVWDGSAWTVVGGSTGAAPADRVPVAWRSTDGRDWTRETVPATSDYEDLHRAVLAQDAVVAVGLRGAGFGSWLRDDGGWRTGGAFGATDPGASRAPRVTGLATSRGAVLAVVSDGARFQLWGSSDGTTWRPVELPLTLAANAEQALAVGSSRSGVVLLADTGDGSRAWRAQWPDLAATP